MQRDVMHLPRRPRRRASRTLAGGRERASPGGLLREGSSLVIAHPGFVVGFVTALTGGFDLTARWLVLAYVLVAANFLNGIALYEPHLKRIAAAAEASDDSTPSPELRALIDSPRTRIIPALDVFLWATIIFVMVVKPLS